MSDQVPTPATHFKTPDITPAQIIAGVPVVADLLHTFGVYTLSAGQLDSLNKAVTWGIGLFAADAVIRVGRAVGNARKS